LVIAGNSGNHCHSSFASVGAQRCLQWGSQIDGDTMTTRFGSDIDIDFGDRERALSLIKYHPASIDRDGRLVRHNTGIYATDIPIDPFTGQSAIDHEEAERRGYIKLDFLNVGVYQSVRNEQHLRDLMATEPLWDLLRDPAFCSLVIHIGNHHDTLMRMPEPVDSIPRMAMFLSVIRPAKRHLIGKSWAEVAKTVWQRPEDDSYYFKKSHAVAYANLVAVHMNLICESVSQGYG